MSSYANHNERMVATLKIRIEKLEAALRLATDALADIGVDDVLIAIDAALGEDRT